jgi:hypothetical protein
MAEDSLQLLRNDLINQAKTLSAIIEKQNETNDALHSIQIDQAVRKVDRDNLDERIKRLEKRMDDLAGIGKWILLAFGAYFITAVASFIVKGGLTVGL